MLRTYPKSVPPEALSLVLAAFQGQPVEKNKAIHAAEETVAFCLGQLFPDSDEPTVVGAVVTDAIPTTAVRGEEFGDVEAAFTSALDTLSAPGEIDGVKISMLSPIVIKLLLRAAREILNRI